MNRWRNRIEKMRRVGHRALFGCCALLCWPMLASGQIAVLEGAGVPLDTLPANWYLDTAAHRVYHRQPDWHLVPSSQVFSLRSCGKYLLMQTVSVTFVALDNEEFLGNGTSCTCLSRVVRLQYQDTQFFWGDAGYLGRAFYSSKVAPGGLSAATDTVGGVPAFCISATQNQNSKVYLNDAHAWGMIDMQGNWIIAPRYDKPFAFENDVAEVLYYGQRRKINAQGALVE